MNVIAGIAAVLEFGGEGITVCVVPHHARPFCGVQAVFGACDAHAASGGVALAEQATESEGRTRSWTEEIVTGFLVFAHTLEIIFQAVETFRAIRTAKGLFVDGGKYEETCVSRVGEVEFDFGLVFGDVVAISTFVVFTLPLALLMDVLFEVGGLGQLSTAGRAEIRLFGICSWPGSWSRPRLLATLGSKPFSKSRGVRSD